MLNLSTYFEKDDNLMITIKAYVCYTCFSWLRPLFSSVNKKMNLSVQENFIEDIDDEKSMSRNSDEIIVLIQRFQQLFDNYINDILNTETLDYFNANDEIERINNLLTTTVHLGDGKLINLI